MSMILWKLLLKWRNRVWRKKLLRLKDDAKEERHCRSRNVQLHTLIISYLIEKHTKCMI